MANRELHRRYTPGGHLPTGQNRRFLQDAIVKLLDVDSPDSITFAEFSSIAASILPNVWSTRRYEGNLHPRLLDPTKKAPWFRVREGLHECGHLGAIIAAFQVPPTWSNSDSRVASTHGHVSFTNLTWSIRTALEAPVKMSVWYLIALHNFGDASTADNFAQDYKGRGALGAVGWKISRDRQPYKDEEGKSTKAPRFRLDLIFKSRRRRDDLLAAMSSQHPHLNPLSSQLDEPDVTWQQEVYFYVNPSYMAFLYAQSLPLNERDALHAVAPSYGVRPVQFADSAERLIELKWVIHFLRHVELFESDQARYPPLTSTVGAGPRSFDLATCPLDMLVNIAFSADNEGLSLPDLLCFRRMVLILQALLEFKGNNAFMAHLLPSRGPYARILRFIADTVCDLRLPDTSFTPKEFRSGYTSRNETLRLTKEGTVNISVELDVAPDEVPRPTQELLEAHIAVIENMGQEFVNLKAAAEKRHNRKGGR